ncbi:MAG: phosphatidate cytidylyltransferase [Bacteroidetes bacterium]|nr:phosphatidate cytidylyltransferase [Bacteroidota bacterium]MBU2585290.1 phosphatidate cytidylyltransferase [Bacteroidota bacterium]
MSFGNVVSRVTVAALAIPLIVGVSYVGGWFFFSLISAITILSLYEFYKLTEKKSALPNYFLGIFFSAATLLLFFYKRTDLVLHFIFAFIVVAAIIELFKKENNSILNLGATVFGSILIGLFFSSLIGIREFYGNYNSEEYSNGGYLVITILSIIWICDSAAYFGGTAIGKRRLLERISPKKSWEGAIFGFVFAIISVIAAKYLILNFLNWIDILYIGVVVGTIGQIGDLIESMIKRNAGVKDSSNLIPGHGGVYDRFDSLLFVSPFVYFYLIYVYG